jgi:NAD(P)-dependent dehydrogenase (short-subunit alcohol dehydrogenase family)
MSTVLVTGATSGLGAALARDLAGRGWTVIAHGRHAERARRLADQLGPPSTAVVADLASLDDVRKLAAEVKAATPALHVLVNNAGVGFGPPGGGRELSRDGHELRFAVNYLAPVLLTRELLPLLKASAPARVVNVGSVGQAPLDLDDLRLDRDYSGSVAYRRAKLALTAWTFDLAVELEADGVTANVLHPASLMPTAMAAESQMDPIDSLEDGLRATRRLVLDPALADTTGRYFNRESPAEAHADTYDPQFRARLQEATDRILGTSVTT